MADGQVAGSHHLHARGTRLAQPDSQPQLAGLRWLPHVFRGKCPSWFVPLSRSSVSPITLGPVPRNLLCVRSQTSASARVICPKGVSAVGWPLSSTELFVAV